METYRLDFQGCKRGAIGMHYPISITVQVPDGTPIEDVKLKAYDEHDHCLGIRAYYVDGGAK